MTVSYTTTAIPNESSIVRGNVGIVAGHWLVTATTAPTAQAIVTGGSDILWGMAQPSTTLDGVVAVQLNVDGYGTASDGTMAILPGTCVLDGTWCAVVKTSGTVPI